MPAEETAEVSVEATNGTTVGASVPLEAEPALDAGADVPVGLTDGEGDTAPLLFGSTDGPGREAFGSDEGALDTPELGGGFDTVSEPETTAGELGTVSGITTGEEAIEGGREPETGVAVVGVPVTGTPIVEPDVSTVTVIGTTTTADSELEPTMTGSDTVPDVSCLVLSELDVN